MLWNIPYLKRNTYIQSPSSHNDHVIYGPGFGLESTGKVALIRRDVYRGKDIGRDFRNHLRSCMRNLEFEHSLAHPHVLTGSAKESDGSLNYEYTLFYTDYHIALLGWRKFQRNYPSNILEVICRKLSLMTELKHVLWVLHCIFNLFWRILGHILANRISWRFHRRQKFSQPHSNNFN